MAQEMINIPVLLPGERIEFYSSAEPIENAQWFWTYQPVGVRAKCGYALTQEDAAEALAFAISSHRVR